MRRREFLGVLGSAAATWPLAAHAQQSATPVVGLLTPSSKLAGKRFYDGFPLGMQQLGYLEGRHYTLESRYADGDITRLPALAKELVQLKPRVIVSGTTNAARAARQASADIPIVGVNMTDPVGNGLVKSEARPETNTTGILLTLRGLTGKQLELARELLPGVARVAILANSTNRDTAAHLQELEAAAATLGMSLTVVEAHTADEVGAAFRSFVREHATVVSVLSDSMFLAMRQQIAAFALAARLPTVYPYREPVETGGLISYGVSLRGSYIRAAYFVDRILKGENPATLPIEFPTTLELVINLATAKALGITVPPSLLARADEVIE